MKRIPLFYFLVLISVSAAIYGVIRQGESLPTPQSTTDGVQQRALVALDQPETISGLIDGLKTNLNSPLSHLFLQLLIIIVVSGVMSRIFSRVGQPSVVGEMAAGILLGPSLFGLLAPNMFSVVFPQDSLGTLGLLSQIGVCFFMFVVGMEVNMKHMRSMAHAAVAVSHASILIPSLLGVMLAYYLFVDLGAPGTTFTAFALFMGISMSITAFPVLARIIKERNLSGTALGTTAVTCAAVDDVTAWSLLPFVVAISRAGSLGGSVVTVLSTLVFVAIMLAFVRRGLPRWIGPKRMSDTEPTRVTLIIIVSLVMISAMSTEIIGVHALFGAFLAGTVMPDVHEFRQRISIRVESFSSVLLLPVFFTYTGLRTQIGLIGDLNGWLLCLLIVAVATIGKLGGSAIAARLTGMGWRDSLQLGALMNTRGLMELIVLNIGYDLGILSSRIFAMLVVMALVTTILTGPLLSLFSWQWGKTNRGHNAPAS